MVWGVSELDELLLHGNLYGKQDHVDCYCCLDALVPWDHPQKTSLPLPHLQPAFNVPKVNGVMVINLNSRKW